MHWETKTPKSEQEKKEPYTLHNFHTSDENSKVYHNGVYVVASIDPAVKNYCIRIESRPRCGFKFPIIPHLFFRTSLENTKLSNNDNLSNLYMVLTELLDQHFSLFLECDYILIEKQMKENTITLRIAQHTISYFMFRLKNTPYRPVIIEVCSQFKAKGIGYKGGLDKRGFKKWCTKKAIEILNKRSDITSLTVMEKEGKKLDDLSDTVCQIEAIFKHFHYPITDDIYNNE